MASRSMWKGNLKVGSTRLPVKLYSAVRDHTIHFHLLDRKTLSRVQQHMVDPDTGRTVAKEEIRKGYEVAKGSFVLLNDEELAQFEPEASRDVEVLEFLSPDKIGSEWYERPYWLGPDGNTKNYFAFAEALRAQEKEAVVRWVMRRKEYVGAIQPHDGYLALVTLRNSNEVVSPQELPFRQSRPSSPTEMKMAQQLIEALHDEFRPEDFKDDYHDRLLSFIDAKARGRKPRLHAVRAKRAPASLVNQLSRSLKAARKDHEKKAA